MIEHVISQFYEAAQGRGYTLQVAEDAEMKEVHRQTKAMGLDSGVYQTVIVYVTGKDGQEFSEGFFAQEQNVTKTKEDLFDMICKAMKYQTELYAFLKHYREFAPFIREQLQVCELLAQAHPHGNSHTFVWMEGYKERYLLPDEVEKLPLSAYALAAERLIVGFKYSKELPGEGKVALFDQADGGIYRNLPRQLIAIKELV